MKEVEEVAAIVPKAEYQEALEKEVALHLARVTAAGVPQKATKKYDYTSIPDFKGDKRAQQEWELEEIRRCRFGFNGIPGKYYFYLNHSRIKHKARGKIRPDFRTIDLEWFKFLTKTENTSGKGIVCLKRRQVGMSWKAAADVIYDCQFNNYFDIGMNSKSENDSRQLFAKVKFIYRNQNDFLRGITSTDRRDALVFAVYGDDQFGNKKVIAGTESSILSVAPTAVSHAGNQYKKLIMDEAGETELLMPIWSNAEDCLMQETTRVGIPIIFGTMGETDKAGAGLKEFWLQHKLYDLEQFAFWGYNALIMDEFGNDDLEESIRWIIYRRFKNESKSKVVYNKFLQKYPLNEKDAFLQTGKFGVGDPVKLGTRELEIEKNPTEKRVGYMRRDGNGEPVFVPDTVNGKVIVYELPDPNRKHGYIATLDPAEDDDVEKKSKNDVSDLALCIGAKPFGLAPPKLVVEYCDRPKKLEDFYSQTSLLLEWYNNTKVHIEMNKGGWRAKDWFELNFPKLIGLSPAAATSAKGGVEMRIGVKMTAERNQQMKGLIDGYVDNYVDFIPSLRLIKQFYVFDADHEDDDLAKAFGWFLVILQADKQVAKHVDKEISKLPKVQFKKVNGRIELVNSGVPVTHRPQSRPNSVLFRR